jgi:cytidylate kinase
MSFIVAIDGPAGSGKGTITKLLAKELNLVNIDTGATYRAITLAAIKKGLTIHDKEKIIELSNHVKIDIDEKQGVFLDGCDVTEQIRTKEVHQLVSQISSIKEVRMNMVKLQRALAEGKDVIMEGRDITTYVFPNADVKIYLDANIEERAKRRYHEMKEKNMNITY